MIGIRSAIYHLQMHPKALRNNYVAPQQRSYSQESLQTIILPDLVKHEFVKRTQHVHLNPYQNYQALAPAMGAILEEILPEKIKLLLTNLAFSDKVKVLYLKNCPHTENPGPTPELDKHSPEKGFVDEFFMLGMTHLKNTTLYHEREEKFGEVIGQVIALKGKEYNKSSQGSSTEFGEHTEQIYLDKPFDWVSLHCIKGDKNAFTEIATIEDFLEGLCLDDIATLQQPYFKMTTGPVWNGSTPLIKIFPVLEFSQSGQFLVRYHKDETRVSGINPEAQAVLKKLRHPLRSIKRQCYTLEHGDYLCINNRAVLHGRCAYTPSNSWKDRRWVLRSYEYNDYERIIARIKACQNLIQNS